MHLEYGLSLEDACRKAMEDAPRPQTPEGTVLVIAAMDAAGRPACCTNSPRGWGCAYMTEGMAGPEALPPAYVAPLTR